MRFALGILLLATLSGCVDADPETIVPPETTYEVTVHDGRVEMEIPVPVVLIGFDEDVAPMLEVNLQQEVVDHLVYDYPRRFLTDSGAAAPVRENWMLPTANYTIHDVPLQAHLREAMTHMQVDGAVNATAVEDWLAVELPKHGVHFQSGAPGLVFLHVDAPYRVIYSSGHIDNARIFGERHNMLVMDVAASADPWVGDYYPWEAPASNGTETVGILEIAARHATHYRLLQGPLYPPSLMPCHGVTLIVASRVTTVTETVPDYTASFDLLDVERLTGYWEALLGEGNVHIDPVKLLLPVDDPVLDAILRYGDNDALRWHMDENWDQYWVPHDDCEAYVSLFLVGDATDTGISGIAMFDANNNRRFSISNFNDLDRMNHDDHATVLSFDANPPDDVYTFDWINFLFSHETGHLFGQRHPHDVSAYEAPSYARTWSSGWTAMSYQVGSKNPEFGSMDYNNHWRNKAAMAIITAQNVGVDEEMVAEAISHMERLQWQAAAETLS